MSQKKLDPVKEIAQDIRKVKEYTCIAVNPGGSLGTTPSFATSAREYPDTMWDALQWLNNHVCHPDATTGEITVDQAKAKAVAMLLTGDDEPEADAWVADFVVAIEQTNVMYGEEGTVPTPFPF